MTVVSRQYKRLAMATALIKAAHFDCKNKKQTKEYTHKHPAAADKYSKTVSGMPK